MTEQTSVASALEALRLNQPGRAETICRRVLEGSPGDVNHLRLLGHALSKQARYGESEQVVRLAISLQPDYPHLHEDLGSVLALQLRFAEAIPCFERAIRLEPRLLLAHKKLGQALACLGKGSEADEAFQAYFELAPLKGQVALAMDHLRSGRKPEAIETLRAALRQDADDVDAMRVLAGICWRDENLSDAEALLRRAAQISPDFTAVWQMLGAMLHDAGRHRDALEAFRKVTTLEPQNAVAWCGVANALANLGDTAAAVVAYRRGISIDANSANAHMGLGHVLKTLGEQAEALIAYRNAIRLKPDFGEAYWSMANLKVFRFEDTEVAAMQEQLERTDLTESADIHFRFALGKAYEDKASYEEAWEYYRTGNERQRRKVYHDPVSLELRHEEITAVFSAEFLAKHAGAGDPSNAPIFIVGLPRSGSTLIEQILASHSMVEGTAELPVLNRIAVQVGRYRPGKIEYPLTVRDLRSKDFTAYGKQYLEDARVFRTTQRPHFTDKLPNNWSHVGFIHLTLPHAVIINARRHPFDSCLGGYKQLFGKGQHFTYDMAELAAYYRAYHETMRHWHKVLPGKVLDVHYEETVMDVETQVRRILTHCGLPFEESCLRFHETQRAVKTASSEQVRQPLYSSALGYWRHFETHLQVWREDLADIIDELPASVRQAGLPHP